MAWEITERLGYFGKKRDEKHKQFDEKYGKENWRITWQWDGRIIPKELAYQLYEDGYLADSFRRESLWEKLINSAKDVYDIEEKDVESGLDYSIQKGIATHLQDIAIRKIVLRRGWKFQGNELIRIRHSDTYWGGNLNPGKVPFHLPHLIVKPQLAGWWDKNSIEDFYQSNKVLQIKK